VNAHDIAARLPSIEVLQGRCRAIAVLDHLVGGGRWPYYSYTRSWPGGGEAALMSNGGGDEWAVVFTGDGAFVRVFDHESATSPYGDEDLGLWPGLVDGLPEEFRPLLEHEAFTDEDNFIATAVLWRRHGDERWQAGEGIEFPEPPGPYDRGDGSAMLEILLDGTAERFVRFAEAFYERPVDLAAAGHVVAAGAVTGDIVEALHPGLDRSGLDAVLADAGYSAP
jgi:hypothetical protein